MKYLWSITGALLLLNSQTQADQRFDPTSVDQRLTDRRHQRHLPLGVLGEEEGHEGPGLLLDRVTEAPEEKLGIARSEGGWEITEDEAPVGTIEIGPSRLRHPDQHGMLKRERAPAGQLSSLQRHRALLALRLEPLAHRSSLLRQLPLHLQPELRG